MRDHKAQIGFVSPFEWVAPVAVDPALVGNARPKVVLRYAAGDSDAIYLSPVVASALAVVAASGRNLTLQAPLVAPQLAGVHGPAQLLADQDGPMPVRVVRIDGTTVILANAPSRPLKAGLTASLYFSTWEGTIPMVATPQRNVPLTVTYTEKGLGGRADRTRVEEGLVHWLPVPFSTGLTHEELCRRRPFVSEIVADREQDHRWAIQEAEDELVAEMRRVLLPLGLWEDDIVARPAALKIVHADLAVAVLYADDAKSEIFRAKALGIMGENGRRRGGGLLDTVLQGIQADVAHNGPVDSERSQVGGPRTTDTGGAFGRGFDPYTDNRRHGQGGRKFTAGGPR